MKGFVKKIQPVLIGLSILIVIVEIWRYSLYLAGKSLLSSLGGAADPANLSTAVSAATSISLSAFSLMVALAAVVGWQAIEGQIKKRVEEVTNTRLEKTEKAAKGRSLAILGYVIGENSVGTDFSVSNRERLIEAIEYCRIAYALLKDTESPSEFMALNNLLSYSCVLGEKRRRGFFLESAERLKIAAIKHDSSNLLLTYCRTVVEFGLEPKERDAAYGIFMDIKNDPRLDEKQKREADHIASLFARNA